MTLFKELMDSISEFRTKEHIKKEKQFLNELKKEYKGAQERVSSVITEIFNSFQVEGVLAQGELLKHNRIDKLTKVVAEEMGNVQKYERNALSKRLKEQTVEEYAFSLFLLSQFGKSSTKKLTDKELEEIMNDQWAGERFDDTLKRKKNDQVNGIRRDILMATASGSALPALNKVVEKRITDTMKHSLLVYQNENTRKRDQAENFANQKANKNSKVQWVSALDDRTCEKCSPLDGEIFDEGKVPDLPVHPRCRCTTIHLIDGWEQTLRSARDVETQKSYLTDVRNFDEYREEQGF